MLSELLVISIATIGLATALPATNLVKTSSPARRDLAVDCSQFPSPIPAWWTISNYTLNHATNVVTLILAVDKLSYETTCTQSVPPNTFTMAVCSNTAVHTTFAVMDLGNDVNRIAFSQTFVCTGQNGQSDEETIAFGDYRLPVCTSGNVQTLCTNEHSFPVTLQPF